jgi:hypothetical protein
MEALYLSQKRFENRIIKRWDKRGFNYHAGHIQLLKYSYRALMFWATKKGERISDKNKVNVHPKLF